MHLTPISGPIFGSEIGKNEQALAILFASNNGSTSLAVVKFPAAVSLAQRDSEATPTHSYEASISSR